MERSVFYDLACEEWENEIFEKEKRKIWCSPTEKLRICWGEEEEHGRYAVFFTEPIWRMTDQAFLEVREKLAEELERWLLIELKGREKSKACVLVAGLGNAKMTADALGPEVVDRVTVTRKLDKFYGIEPSVSVSAVSTGVLGTTGIETVEHLRALCECIQPHIVIAVDALSAKRRESLGRTVQVSTGALFPGAGVGKRQGRISQSTLGVPVLSLGVPTVIHSSAILCEAFEKLGVENWEEAKRLLSRENGFFVMPKESDLLLRSSALLLSSAINQACRLSFSSSHTFESL